jgi:hypothetical protein
VRAGARQIRENSSGGLKRAMNCKVAGRSLMHPVVLVMADNRALATIRLFAIVILL